MVAEQPQHRVRPVVAARDGRILGPALGGRGADRDFQRGDLEGVLGVLLGGGDFLGGELTGHDRIAALDALRHVAVGDAFDLKHVQAAELRHLLECQGGVFDQPNGGGLGH